MDLNKYAVQSSSNSPTKNLSKYSVATEAPTLDQLFSLQQAYKPALEKETLLNKASKRGSYAVESVLGEQKYPGQPILGVTGALGGLANDIIGALLSPVIDTVVDKTSDIGLMQSLASSKLGSKGVDISNKAIQGASSTFKKFEEKAPGAARLVTDVFNTSTLIPAGAATKEAGAIVKDTASIASRAMNPTESAIQSKLISMFEKSVKPTAKKTNVAAERYSNDVVSALTEIKSRSNQLNIEDLTGELVSRSPQSLNELNQALEQTKKLVFDEYDALARATNDKGVRISVDDVVKQLDTVSINKALELTSPDVIKYAQNWSERLRNIGELDAETTQEVIKTINNNLQSFYKNPSYDLASKVAVDASIANNLRKALDEAIEGATGESYSELKRVYGSLKAIENDVTRAAMRDGRKNVKGLLDYTDIFTSGQIVSGILSLNPAMFTKGAIERGFKEYIKLINDPNRVIKNIFDVLDRRQSEFMPTSSTFKALQKNYPDGVPVGMSIKSTISPEKVAAKLDVQEYRIIREYLLNPADTTFFPKAQQLMEKLQIDKADEATQIRFLKEVVNEYDTLGN